jgi:hypothetical protein
MHYRKLRAPQREHGALMILLTVNYLAATFLRKHSMVFSIRHVIVIGPTPPGTGVMTEALGSIAA